jgi:hypothetical protein
VKAAKIEQTVTFHNLRAAHASWLLAGGADIVVVQERLGTGRSPPLSSTPERPQTLGNAPSRLPSHPICPTTIRRGMTGSVRPVMPMGERERASSRRPPVRTSRSLV